MQEIHRIGVVSLGRILAVIYGVIGLIAGGFISIFALVGASIERDMPPAFAFLFGAAAVVVMPLLYAGFAFVMGLVIGAIYNLIASTAGGLRVELRDTGESSQWNRA